MHFSRGVDKGYQIAHGSHGRAELSSVLFPVACQGF